MIIIDGFGLWDYFQLKVEIVGMMVSAWHDYYSCPGRRPLARVIKCIVFFCIIFPPLENEQIAQ